MATGDVPLGMEANKVGKRIAKQAARLPKNQRKRPPSAAFCFDGSSREVAATAASIDFDNLITGRV
jgi:hypothetical protein